MPNRPATDQAFPAKRAAYCLIGVLADLQSRLQAAAGGIGNIATRRADNRASRTNHTSHPTR